MFGSALYCEGCYRTEDEIREWMIMSRGEKLAVLEKISVRKEENQISSFSGDS